MRWYYKLLEDQLGYFLYAYSRESKDYSGRIRYDKASGTAEVTLRCEADEDDYDTQKALEHFQKVINDSFPEERSVCCG